MKRNIKQYRIIKNSLNQSFIFYIDDKKNLIYEVGNVSNDYEEGSILENNVLDFSASIDKDERLHLIFLLSSGDLMYSIYLNETWEKNLILKLDTKSNIYRHLNLLLHENYINIFYTFTNLINTNLWTIEHITKDAMQWRKKTVANIYTEKDFKPFYLDKDKLGNIYLIYIGREYASNHIYYTSYNVFIKEWNKTATKISYSETDNMLPYLFIDVQDNIHVLWYSSDNSNHIISYKRLAQTGKARYHWKGIRLPKIPCGDYPPIMFEKENKLNILCITENEIQRLSSKNSGLNWELENSIPLDSEASIIEYATDFLWDNTNNKINHYYGTVDGDIYFYFDEKLDKKPVIDHAPTSTVHEEVEENIEDEIEQSEVEIQQETVEPSEEDRVDLKRLVDIITDMSKEIASLKEDISSLEKNQNSKKRFFGSR